MNVEHEQLTVWGLSKVTVQANFKILDVGCGGGKTIIRLANLAPQGKVFGIDYSHDMVKYSKKINKELIAQNRVNLFEESVEQMSFQDNLFDLITAFETYFFWANFPRCLKEIRRILKPGGNLLLVNAIRYKTTSETLSQTLHLHLLPLKEIPNNMQSNGFESVNVFSKPGSNWNAVVAQK